MPFKVKIFEGEVVLPPSGAVIERFEIRSHFHEEMIANESPPELLEQWSTEHVPGRKEATWEFQGPKVSRSWRLFQH